MQTTTILAGHVGVDSGQVMIGDPCYLKDWGGHEFISMNKPYTKPFDYSYDGACRATCSDDQYGELQGGLAVATSSGYGDGVYPVYVEKNSDGRVIALHVYFDNDPNENEEEDDYDEDDYLTDPDQTDDDEYDL